MANFLKISANPGALVVTLEGKSEPHLDPCQQPRILRVGFGKHATNSDTINLLIQRIPCLVVIPGLPVFGLIIAVIIGETGKQNFVLNVNVQ